MLTVILLVVLVGLAVAAMVIGGARPWVRGLGLGSAAAAVILLGLSTTAIVPTRQVGIPISFGVAGEPMSTGLVFKAPWTSVELMDTTFQALDATGDKATVAKDADMNDVFVHNNVRWAVAEKHATSVYNDTKDFDRVGDLLVQPNLRTATATVMDDYRPLDEDHPDVATIADHIKAELQRRVGERIIIHSVSVTLIDLSETTKGRINALNAERANTAIAEQREQTALKEAAANRALAESVSNDPNVVVANCVEAVRESTPGTFPAGFQCWPGTAGGVVIPAATAKTVE